MPTSRRTELEDRCRRVRSKLRAPSATFRHENKAVLLRRSEETVAFPDSECIMAEYWRTKPQSTKRYEKSSDWNPKDKCKIRRNEQRCRLDLEILLL